jgi:glyoxylase-like metal-dependent hydrolase (beta-lactamase superfamily II)
MTFTREVASGVHRVEDSYTNWYLVEGDDGITIVDAGVPTSWDSLQAALRELGRSTDDLRALLLTHAHFDHVGFAERARKDLGLPVYLHDLDVPLSRHPGRPDSERWRGLYFATQVQALPLVATMVRNRAFWPAPVGKVHRYGDGVVDVPGRPVVVPCPGHTYGHVALHLPDRDVLLAGDAIVTLDPYTMKRGPRLVARAATAYVERNLQSLDALAATGARTVLTGHGEPWTDGAEAAADAARRAGAA